MIRDEDMAVLADMRTFCLYSKFLFIKNDANDNFY